MSTKNGQAVVPSTKKGKSHERLLQMNSDASSLDAEKSTSPAISSSPATQVSEPEKDDVERLIGRKVIDAAKMAKDYLIQKWKPAALGLLGMGIVGVPVVLPMPMNEVREMHGWAPPLKPLRDCKKPLTSQSSIKEIDEFLANPENYGGLQKDVWEITVGQNGEFKGVQWLRTKGNAPMKVTGYLAKGDWIDGAIRGIKGHGSYHLEARNNEEIYRGTLTALECALPQDMVIVCPYVLTPTDTLESEVGLAGAVCRRYVSSAELKSP